MDERAVVDSAEPLGERTKWKRTTPRQTTRLEWRENPTQVLKLFTETYGRLWICKLSSLPPEKKLGSGHSRKRTGELVQPSDREEYELSDAIGLLIGSGRTVDAVELEEWRIDVGYPETATKLSGASSRNHLTKEWLHEET